MVVCYHRKMKWHLNALGPGHVRSAPSRIFRCIGIMGMCGNPESSLASVEMDLQTLIAIKELIPVVLAAATFGNQWSDKVAQFVVDNSAVVKAGQPRELEGPRAKYMW